MTRFELAGSHSKMKGRRSVSFGKSFVGDNIPSLLCLSVVTFIGFSGCRKQVDSVPATTKQPVAVNVLTLSKVNETVRTATFFGSLTANRTFTAAFTAPGKIKFLAPLGQSVSANESLAELDVDELAEQRQTLLSQIAQATNEQAVQQLQQKISGLDKQMQAGKILAPFDCIVDEVFAYENSLVQPKSPILRVIDSKNPKIEINLPRRVARFVDADLEVFFVLENQALVGMLAEKSKTENAGSVSCRFEITSDLSEIKYWLGQTVEVRFDFQSDNSGYWVPMRALDRSGEGIWSLLVVESFEENYVVARRLVTIVQVNDDKALVAGDRLDGTMAISNGIHRVVPGQKVNPQNQPNGGDPGDEEATE